MKFKAEPFPPFKTEEERERWRIRVCKGCIVLREARAPAHSHGPARSLKPQVREARQSPRSSMAATAVFAPIGSGARWIRPAICASLAFAWKAWRRPTRIVARRSRNWLSSGHLTLCLALHRAWPLNVACPRQASCAWRSALASAVSEKCGSSFAAPCAKGGQFQGIDDVNYELRDLR